MAIQLLEQKKECLEQFIAIAGYNYGGGSKDKHGYMLQPISGEGPESQALIDSNFEFQLQVVHPGDSL